MGLKESISGAVDKLQQATDEEDEKQIWDKALDIVEILVESTPTKIDDFIVKPLIGILRRRFDIPDND